MKIGTLAQRTGLSRDTIRFYERQGLISSQPGDSETNNYRDYPEDLVSQLDVVTHARAAGMPIAELKKLLAAMDLNSDPTESLQIIGQQIHDLRTHIDASRRVIGLLRAARGQIRKHHTE
ncbi:MerR family transcriptional regulator [Shimia litoralis]|uniref:MerR family transcriptional regulator n=1 Tax=Shimia litoralis TaxID=420403 RepID=A0A4U7MW70_9RHOB|nr:MerR family transcriptional regulator [Shimia litoralis]TKZ17410.1 MerR family transcriptional regulator [Shimia litoralis]